jgi:hypothetical protein
MAIYSSNEYVVTIGGYESRAACYVFDRKTGNFVRQISRIGQGPGEFTEVVDRFWDEKNEQVCVYSHPNYIFYNLDGTISHQINRNDNPFWPSTSYSNFYINYISNQSGNQTIRILFHDRAGTLIDSIPNFRTWKKTQSIGGGGTWSDGKFYVFSNELYYVDIYCDTLYHVKDFKLQPRYVFNTEGRTLPYQIHDDPFRYPLLALMRGNDESPMEKYFVIDKILEDSKNLYFSFDYRKKRYPAIYDKKKEFLQLLLPASIPLYSKDWKVPLHGFENDLDGGLLFWPQQVISEKEMMCVYSAEELLELDKEKITDPKLIKVLNCLKEDSNPVVAIVTIKD